jgi:hypothetical protein
MNVEGYKIMRDNDFDPNFLDPGIRRVVVWLRSLGYRTTDSGDGVSKPPEARVMGDRPHVFMVVPTDNFFADVDRLADAVDAFGIECGEWDQDAEPFPPGLVLVQGQYSGGLCTLSVTGLHEGNLPAGLGL